MIHPRIPVTTKAPNANPHMSQHSTYLRPVAEAVAVLALPVAEVECHDTTLVVNAQGCKGPSPHVNSIFKGEVGVSRLSGVTCMLQRGGGTQRRAATCSNLYPASSPQGTDDLYWML
jgi:hypothetical protein